VDLIWKKGAGFELPAGSGGKRTCEIGGGHSGQGSNSDMKIFFEKYGMRQFSGRSYKKY